MFLTPGFNTSIGTNFLAAVGPCGGRIDNILLKPITNNESVDAVLKAKQLDQEKNKAEAKKLSKPAVKLEDKKEN